MFEIVDGWTDGRQSTDYGRRTDAGVTGILLAHPSAFGSGELKRVTIGPSMILRPKDVSLAGQSWPMSIFCLCTYWESVTYRVHHI